MNEADVSLISSGLCYMQRCNNKVVEECRKRVEINMKDKMDIENPLALHLLTRMHKLLAFNRTNANSCGSISFTNF